MQNYLHAEGKSCSSATLVIMLTYLRTVLIEEASRNTRSLEGEMLYVFYIANTVNSLSEL